MVNKNYMVDTMECNYKKGHLEPCAPLAAAYVPFQQENPPTYGHTEALMRGTLFPGLDLPFMNVVNKTVPCANTPLGELKALAFVIKELNLYLDTHCDDMEAFRMLQKIIALYNEGREKYVKLYGPLTVKDSIYTDSYKWLCDPWPWEYAERMEKK